MNYRKIARTLKHAAEHGWPQEIVAKKRLALAEHEGKEIQRGPVPAHLSEKSDKSSSRSI